MERGVQLPWGVFTDAVWAMISSPQVWLADPVFLSEPVEGWRAWGVDTSGNLRSITYPHMWGDGSNDARCASHGFAERVFSRRQRAVENLQTKRFRAEQTGEVVEARLPDPEVAPVGHVAPHVDCGCGFWVFKNESVLRGNKSRLSGWMHDKYTGWLVTGQARAWGSAVEHEHGWRAEHATAFGDVVIHGLQWASNREALLPFLAEKIREKNRVIVHWADERGEVRPIAT